MWLYLIFLNEQKKGSDETLIVSTAFSRLWGEKLSL